MSVRRNKIKIWIKMTRDLALKIEFGCCREEKKFGLHAGHVIDGFRHVKANLDHLVNWLCVQDSVAWHVTACNLVAWYKILYFKA